MKPSKITPKKGYHILSREVEIKSGDFVRSIFSQQKSPVSCKWQSASGLVGCYLRDWPQWVGCRKSK